MSCIVACLDTVGDCINKGLKGPSPMVPTLEVGVKPPLLRKPKCGQIAGGAAAVAVGVEGRDIGCFRSIGGGIRGESMLESELMGA